MKKNNIIIGAFIFILVFISSLFLEKVEAKEILNPKIYFGIIELRESGMGYAMGNPSTGAERIWNIVQYTDESYTNSKEANVYCIKADTGFSNATKTDIYDVTYNMKTEKDAIAKQNDILKGLINNGQYDNLLALGDLLYVPGVSTKSEKEQLLEESGIMDILRSEYLEDIEECYITDDEIEAVQQAAIWYFTNYGEEEYDKYGKTSWIWYTENGTDYQTLSSYNAPIGAIRKEQVEALYKYLIDTAKSNASNGINDEKTMLTVYASNSNSLAQPIMEVKKLPKEFDLSLRKYITAINDKQITNTRVPVIDESTLKNGTTAIYKHRKDPIEVKTNDIITYNITVYNEGELAGRATKIVDQLPQGLQFVEVVSGNFEKSAYSEQNNTLYLTRKANNTNNLAAYVEGKLSSETIQIKCKVTQTGETNDKILTNIAWISEEIDENENIITNEKGQDRDSEPSTITTQTKDQLVTIDNGYVGNSSNNEKDLTNKDIYFEGQQDDDDFEKVVVRAVTNIEVSKVWEDNSNQDGIRAKEVVVRLLKNGVETDQTVILNDDNGWTDTFENLPTKENGVDITYTVKETTVINGYTTGTDSTTDSTGKSYTITNTHEPETISVSVSKIWNDNGNQDGLQPKQIEIALKKGTEIVDTIVLNSNNSWKHTFAGLAKYENGKEIEYSVEEVDVPEGYTESVNEDSKNNYTITNTHIPEVTSISVNKVWVDNDNQDGIRPEEIEVVLYKNGEETAERKTLRGDDWTATFDNLPVNENGKKITYTVREVNEPEGYTSSGEGTEENNYTITNTHETQTTSISVNKEWVDNNNQDGIRPEEIEVVLYKNGEETAERKTLRGDDWTATFDNLPVNENGKKITYTVKEVSVPEGYTTSGEGTEENNYTITNTHTPGLTSISVNKVWVDNNNQDGIRPESIEVVLYKNGEETAERKTLRGDDWTATFGNLPVNENGKKITYTVKEVSVPEGYTSSGEGTEENGYTITNTHTPGLTSINVNKVWVDNNNQDGIRPEEIEVVLYKNGEETGNIITLSEENHWTGTFNNLPIKENGVDINYTVREITQIEGYTTEITENTNNIENTESVANTNETKTTKQTYATKSMVRATTGNAIPKSFKITNTHFVEEEFDLALRKFIAAVSRDETIEESEILKNEDGTSYEREPMVDTSKLNTKDENGNTITTAMYNHTKEPVLVKKNDIVIYMLRIYNEGEQDGYASEITDYLPSYLEFVESEFNEKYGWKVSEDGRKVTTRYLENSLVAKPQIDESGNYELSYVQVPIMCKVSDNAKANENITNMADITEYQDADKNPVKDRDSEENNIEVPTDEELPGYKDEEIDKDYVPGQEDDDDFEKVYVEDFDLALRKFISEVDGTTYNREPSVDLSGLENGTTAIYNHPKDPVPVRRNSVVIYTIRVYNESRIDGYAEEITDYLPAELEYLPDHEINIQYEWKISEDGRIVTTDYLSSAKETEERQNELKAYDGERLDYKEVKIACRVKEEAESKVNLTNLAEITEDSDKDRDSTPDNVEVPSDEELPGYKDEEIDQEYVPGQEDDDDFEKVYVQDFDLALRKFITKVDEEEVDTRIPEVSYDREEDKITYNHTKDPVEVVTGNVVEYTIRVYNEGDIAGYAEEVADDIPDGLKFLPENETNKEYRWVMYDEEGNETENVEEAVEIRTDYLSKEQEETEGENLLEAFNPEEEIGEGNPDYRDIKVAFEVVEPNESDRIIVNSAQITEDSDENGNPVEDKDSIPDEWNEGEDDQDKEYIKLTYFDLALRKWVTEAIVIENGQETVTQTGHTAEMDPEPVVKVELYRKDINDVVVKFRYKIRVTNEGDIAGYAKEITDYVPEGLRFIAEDNPGWTDEGNNIISTRLLENTLLQPGESAEVEVVLTWINGEDNMGQMTNIAEISEDYNDKGVPDRDSTPDNQVPGEDDIDDAPVLLSIETGQQRIYFVLGLTVLGTLAGGLVLIKKFVI